MSDAKTTERWARRTAAWLPRLADPEAVDEAAAALMAIDFEAVEHDDGPGRDPDDASLPRYRRAIERLDDVDPLVAGWMDRFFETLDAGEAWQAALAETRQRGEAGLPPFESSRVYTGQRLRAALRAAGVRLGPHVARLIARLRASQADVDEEPRRTAQRDVADAVLDVLAEAGPSVVAARAEILAEFRGRGVWSWPSNLIAATKVLAAADPTVIDAIRAMLDEPDHRNTAISALGAIGVAAGDATSELLAFQAAEDAETRYGAIYAMAKLGPPTPAVLDAFDAAFDDASVDVRMAVTIALRQQLPEPARFVPRVIAMCDEREYVHDYVVPEEAIETLAAYGRAAADALPRLRAFVDGPIGGRTVEPAVVLKAIERITGEAADVAVIDPPRRATPPADEEPLWPITLRGRLAYVDARGEVALATGFERGGRFAGGRAVVRDGEYAAHVIDRRGDVVVGGAWDEVEPFREGRAAVKRDGRWGFVDVDGRVVVEPQYDAVTPFREGLAGVEVGRVPQDIGGGITSHGEGRRGFVDASGRVVIPIEIDRPVESFYEGRAVICTGGEMRPSLWDESRLTFAPREWGYLGRDGHLAIDGRYLMAMGFREGRAAVYRGSDIVGRTRQGYVDPAGVEVIPLEFTTTTSFRDGLAIVTRRGRRWRQRPLVIDPHGNVILESPHPRLANLGGGLFSFHDGDAYGIVDRTGARVVEPQFDQIKPFADGLAEVARGAWYGLIDPTGRMVYGPTTDGQIDSLLRGDWTT